MPKLAIDGGKPVRSRPFPARVMFDRREVAELMRLVTLGTRQSTPSVLDRYSGPLVTRYEKEFAAYFGTKFATAVSSGTAAIHSALAALRLEPGDQVVTTPITDPGTVMPILFQGCVPVFADVDYRSMNISARTIEKVLTKRTRAVIPVHLAGVPCEMDGILRLARKHRLRVIEDCAQAHGSLYRKRYVGTLGDMGAFSMMSSKHMTSGGQGGMVITSRESFYWDAKRFADRGKPFGIPGTEGNVSLGLNYRMTELEAAIGRIQMRKLRMVAAKRFLLVEKLRDGVRDMRCFRLWDRPENSRPNYWFLFFRIEPETMSTDRDHVIAALRAEGIPVEAHYVSPMYRCPFLRDRNTFGTSGYPWNPYAKDIRWHCPEAERASGDYARISLHEKWSVRDMEDVLKAFEKVEKAFRR